ncbi:SDR family oxidoreductase [Pseudanabaena sp. UWO311]|uniref:SDR family oxidoreductase n=1 Tax=Pseudanabaena sp. UWO311 TaxID=2487337 RepID=UPI00115C15BC|nr:SDR family oxidoreductase [Pseudanabaena sp. UWO311]TYQ27795.1 SDR family oxidoreductase [Pseudanabaena sp. UWO311]
MTRLSGKTALITGGTSGIGLATAELFVKEGAEVIITGQNQERLNQAVSAIGHRVTGLLVNQTDTNDAKSIANQVKARFEALDILFLNAGVTMPAATNDEREERFDEQMTINLKAPFFIMQNLAPLMRSGSSVIANTSCLDQMGIPGMAVYAATKAGLRSLVRTWAAEFVGHKIRVNAIAPGPINTPIYGKLGFTAEALQEMATDIQSKVPMGRFGNPEEIAKAVLFLASDESSYMLGEEIVVDGGWAAL